MIRILSGGGGVVISPLYQPIRLAQARHMAVRYSSQLFSTTGMGRGRGGQVTMMSYVIFT